MYIEIKTEAEATEHHLPTGKTCLVAEWRFGRPDDQFSGLSLRLQASYLNDQQRPDEVDADLFRRVATLIPASSELLEALKSAKHMLERDFIDGAKMAVIEKCDAAIAKATSIHACDAVKSAALLAEALGQPAVIPDGFMDDNPFAEEDHEVDHGHDDDRDHLTEENTDFGDDLAYLASADDGDAEPANETRLLGGVA